MPRHPSKLPSARRGRREPEAANAGRFPKPWILAAIGAVAVAVVAVVWTMLPERPEGLRERAEAATRAEDWPQALRLWREVNKTRLARGSTYLAEARACLALNLAASAELALSRSIAADPTEPEPWIAALQLLWVEDRPLEALRTGWEAYQAVPPESRRDVLSNLTMALLADVPDQKARERLGRWLEADPTDDNARVALLQWVARQPMSGDPDRPSRIQTLTAILDRAPNRIPAREALAMALADDGQPDRGRQVLESWPENARDARYWRLLGRWQLDYDHQYKEGVVSFERALEELPHDWRTQYRLARALKNLGRTAEANRVAETVRRLHEVLDPATLGPRLNDDLKALDNPRSLLDLADLCSKAGLTRLAEAWRRESLLAPTSDRGAMSKYRSVMEIEDRR